MLYTAGVQKLSIPRYASERFTPVMESIMTHRMLDAVPWQKIRPALGSDYPLGSDFTKLIALSEAEHRTSKTNSTQRHNLEG